MCSGTYRIWASSLSMVILVVSGGCGDSSVGGLLGSVAIDNGKEFGGRADSVAGYRDRLTGDEAYHLLRRAAFGATPEEVDRAVRLGLSATVDDLLNIKQAPPAVSDLAESYEEDISKRWLTYLLDGPNPLQDRLAMFWHDRFAASRRVLDGRDSALSLVHWKMLRKYALGNYREFLQELTIDPLMLIWLDGANSPKDNPNENYAREFWELFTLGRDTLYTEQDIREGARAFTGITLLRESDLNARPIFDLLNHDETIKSIFPERAVQENYDYLSVIDLTLEQDEASEYVARNLFTFFVHDHPSESVIRSLAGEFAAGDFKIASIVRRILLSQAMFSEDARGNRISTPVEQIVGIARTFDMHPYSEDSQGGTLDRLTSDLRDAGQELLNPPGVQGWGENEFWLQDQWLINRVHALGRTMEYGPERTSDLPYHLLPPVERWSEREIRGEIVDALASALHISLTEEEKDIYVEVLDQNGWRAFHLEEPDRQPRHVSELIRLMAMHEDVITQ